MLKAKSNSSLLSVGLPVYNGGAYLSETIESILNQDYTDFELLISDNFSDDETSDICRQYANRDNRISYWKNVQNIGAPDNYNLVFHAAKGRYFKWMSSNDLCGEGLFRKCIETLSSSDQIVLAYPQTRLFSETPEDFTNYDGDIELLQRKPSERLAYLLDNTALNNVMNGIIKSSVLSKTGLHRAFFASDVCLMAELALWGHFVEVEGTYFYRRENEQSMVTRKSKKQQLEHWTPDRRTPLKMQHWRYYLYLFGGTFRVNLTLCETYKVIRSLLRRMVWSRHKLMLDIVDLSPFGKDRSIRNTVND